MKSYEVLIEPEAQKDLREIYDFIASNDTHAKAKNFLHKLEEAILSLDTMPKRHRKSIYVDREDVRDMVVYGYTICYAVKEDRVHVLTVFRQRPF
ncbi:type II toxin-antitoxin system RelE/ParE family toxin [Hydrogenimonas sp. SS33]|uniref:type II toxin-antitoxin system RelE/ParE family toxin n=1 Tax=Hydrogenimonas leucolamina TaxID=2954236 RepID=UPI00336BD2FD